MAFLCTSCKKWELGFYLPVKEGVFHSVRHLVSLYLVFFFFFVSCGNLFFLTESNVEI